MKRSENYLDLPAKSEIDLLKAEQKASDRDWGEEAFRILRIQAEIVDGFQNLKELGPAVTFLGSARLPQDHPASVKAQQTAKLLSKEGIAVITGGGPGIMEAANRGAHKQKGASVGLNIELPFEQKSNPHLDIQLEFRYFFVRKLMFVKYAFAFVFFPGGFGTLDELFTIVTLMQTKKINRFPIVLFDKKFWEPLHLWIRTQLIEQKMISTEDPDLFTIVDKPQDVLKIIKKYRSALKSKK